MIEKTSMTTSTEQFYNTIPVYTKSLLEMLVDNETHPSLPGDWWVIVSDIENSTYEYERNFYENINVIAGETLRVVLQVAEEAGVSIPYVYGGDGMTAVVPARIKDTVLLALAEYRDARQEYLKGTHLRIGALPVSDIQQAGFAVSVAKFLFTTTHPQPLFVDAGIGYAERLIKDHLQYQVIEQKASIKPKGVAGIAMQWEVLYAPGERESVLCLIVLPGDVHGYESIYHDIITHIERVYGGYSRRHPHVHTLRGGREIATDVLKLDGSLKTIVVGTDEQAERLLDFLRDRESQGMLTFGYVHTGEPIVTSIIEEREGVQIGLVDVSGGGYTMAAKMLKEKLGTL